MRIMEIRALLPVSWHYVDYGNFDPRPQAGPAPAAARTKAPMHVSSQNFDPFAFQKPKLGHMREQALLFILVWLGARCPLKRDLSDHVKMLSNNYRGDGITKFTDCESMINLLTQKSSVSREHDTQ